MTLCSPGPQCQPVLLETPRTPHLLGPHGLLCRRLPRLVPGPLPECCARCPVDPRSPHGPAVIPGCPLPPCSELSVPARPLSCVCPAHSTAPSVCPAACVLTGWWPTAKVAALLWLTAPVCTMRPAIRPARPSEWAATLGTGTWGAILGGRHSPIRCPEGPAEPVGEMACPRQLRSDQRHPFQHM